MKTKRAVESENYKIPLTNELLEVYQECIDNGWPFPASRGDFWVCGICEQFRVRTWAELREHYIGAHAACNTGKQVMA